MKFNYDHVELVEIKDGDTFVFDVDFGFNVSSKQIFRLIDTDTSETYQPSSPSEYVHGVVARRVAAILLAEGVKTLTSESKSSIYGRFDASIILDDGTDLKDFYKKNLLNKDQYEEFVAMNYVSLDSFDVDEIGITWLRTIKQIRGVKYQVNVLIQDDYFSLRLIDPSDEVLVIVCFTLSGGVMKTAIYDKGVDKSDI